MEVKVEHKISEEQIFEMEWMKIHLDTVEIEGAGQASRIVVEHPGAACLLAITPDNKVLLVKQFRYPVGHAMYEIPAGKNDTFGGDFFATAKRELAEETPFTAQKLELLYGFYTAPGFCNEFIHLYKATGLQENSELTLDEDEFIEVCYFSKAEIKTLLHSGKIVDAKTIIAVQYWLNEDE